MSRLEEIKEHVKWTVENELQPRVEDSDLEWLIKQAGRVQELEEDLLELIKQNKELRKSIAFYSSESYNAHLERLLDRSEKQIKRYREVIKKAIDDLENECLWDALVALKALEEEEK